MELKPNDVYYNEKVTELVKRWKTPLKNYIMNIYDVSFFDIKFKYIGFISETEEFIALFNCKKFRISLIFKNTFFSYRLYIRKIDSNNWTTRYTYKGIKSTKIQIKK